MSLKEDIEKAVDDIIKAPFKPTEGQVVPESDDVALDGGVVTLEASILYADLADSTRLAMDHRAHVAAETIKSFLTACSRVIRAHKGEIRSFDGDRVMGIFIGNRKCTESAKCAMEINAAITDVVRPKLEKAYPALTEGAFRIAHCVGIDVSDVWAVRAGIRGSNDLIWVGRAPNVAAKLSVIRDSPYYSYSSKQAYARFADEAKISTAGVAMWEEIAWKDVPEVSPVYRSHYRWWCS